MRQADADSTTPQDTILPVGESQDDFPFGPGQGIPYEALRALNRLRLEAEAEIERLLSFLDASEPDPDLEPSLGLNPYGGNDAEHEHDGAEPDHDGEEDDHAEDDGTAEEEPDREPDADSEPAGFVLNAKDAALREKLREARQPKSAWPQQHGRMFEPHERQTMSFRDGSTATIMGEIR